MIPLPPLVAPKGPDADEVVWNLSCVIPKTSRRSSVSLHNSRRVRAGRTQTSGSPPCRPKRPASDAAAKSAADAAAKMAALTERSELARSVQFELKRVGCLDAAVSPEFGAPARDALNKFAKFAAVNVGSSGEISERYAVADPPLRPARMPLELPQRRKSGRRPLCARCLPGRADRGEGRLRCRSKSSSGRTCSRAAVFRQAANALPSTIGDFANETPGRPSDRGRGDDASAGQCRALAECGCGLLRGDSGATEYRAAGADHDRQVQRAKLGADAQRQKLSLVDHRTRNREAKTADRVQNEGAAASGGSPKCFTFNNRKFCE